MEKERSSQQQFSIYSNKGGIVVKEELPSEKAFTKIVKEKDIAIDEQTKLERNVTLNFDHSVVDGVLAIEMACAPKSNNLSGPISQNQNQNQNLVSVQKIIKEKKALDQDGIAAQLKENQIVSNDLSNLKLEEEIPLMDGTIGTSCEAGTSNISSTGTQETKLQDLFSMKIQNPNEDSTDSINGQGSPGTSNNNPSENPPSPSKERITMQNNQEKKVFVNNDNNNNDNNNSNNNNISWSIPSTPSSPVPNSGSLSIQSDSASTSARSFAFPVLQRDWATSPAKLPKADKGRFGKCRGCSAIFCCKF